MQHNLSSKPLRKHRHETSMDNFIKNIKRHNQRSERYMSPPLLYMYSRNHTTNTMDKSRSRTLSNRKSSVGGVSKVKKKIDKILKEKGDNDERNPAYVIEQCGGKLKKLEKYLQKKNQIGHYLCQNFLKMLNEIVEKMINNLDAQIRDIESKAIRKVEHQYNKQIATLSKNNLNLQNKLRQSLQKLGNNTQLIYQIRMLSQIDIDYLYGNNILNTTKCGGFGYGKTDASQVYSDQSDRIFQHSQRDSSQVSEEAKVYRKELFNIEEPSTSKKKQRREGVENEGEHEDIIESGRIRAMEGWQKQKMFPMRRPPAFKEEGGNQFEEQGGEEDGCDIFSRRLT